MELNIQHTSVFSKNHQQYQQGKRFILNQGGSRSSKTYSIIQLLIFICLTKSQTKVSIVRKSLNDLKKSALSDFIDIMTELGLYIINNHNKTEQKYYFSNGSVIEFMGLQTGQKVKGAKRDICYLNEADELDFDDFQQLSLRTAECLFIDFNPSESESWLYELLKDERSTLIKSTYKDNNFLPVSQITEIENLINVDENYYKIYALGERPVATSRIYTHFKQYIDEPKEEEIDDVCYGLDFGHNHPAALVKVTFTFDKIYVKELLYERKLTVSALCEKVRDLIGDRKTIYCDSARPDIIAQLNELGLKAMMSKKNVKEGIDAVKSSQIYVHHDSTNLLKEYKLYSWKMRGTQILDEPVKLNDDALDAVRYAIFTNKKDKFDERYAKIYV